jgi:uncharacterized membrane protein YphA (DoxX/SURF4 family)
MLIRRVARPLLASAFIGQGLETLRSPKPAAVAAQPTLDGLHKLPDPVASNAPQDAETLAKITAAVQIGGGLLLATGRLPRFASAALAATVIPANLGAHMFWAESDPEIKARKRREFTIDLSLLGGLIIASADTAGKPSLGWRGRRAAQNAADAVASALPSSISLSPDHDIADKLSHGLSIARARGAELVDSASDLAVNAKDFAQDQGGDLVSAARKRGKKLARH